MNLVVQQRQRVERNAAPDRGDASYGAASARSQNFNSIRMLRRSRAAFTLMELVLVVAIVIVVAALATPSIQRTFSRQALQKGADRVRVAMGQALSLIHI